MGQKVLLSAWPKDIRKCNLGECPAYVAPDDGTGNHPTRLPFCLAKNTRVEKDSKCEATDEQFVEYVRRLP